MWDVEELIKRLRELDYDEILAYWRESEMAEAELYLKLAERAEKLGLPDEVVETFRKLAEDSKRHASELPPSDSPPGLPPIEVLPVIDLFERADQVREVLEAAMKSELIAMNAYKVLAEKAGDERLRKLYLRLADVERGHYLALERLYRTVGGEDGSRAHGTD